MKEQQKKHIIDMMEADEELGLYDIFNDEKRQGVKDLIDAHKQETFEEASWKFNPLKKLDGEFLRHAFKEGAKWQQEQDKNKYSEEEVKPLLDAIKYFIDRVENGTIRSKTTYKMYKELFEQFKNK
jgi:hypothetical protein